MIFNLILGFCFVGWLLNTMTFGNRGQLGYALFNLGASLSAGCWLIVRLTP